MNTTLQSNYISSAKPLIQRFAWKEYRMLRGFWIAVALLTLLEQVVSARFMFDVKAIPSWMFASAWGAAALYAIGATITLFSAEREERTRDYLVQLPSNWQLMFAGKLLAATVSTLALALLLSFSGYVIAGGVWPSQPVASDILRVAGVAVVEATVWGLLFSLMMKQPLLAAVAAMGAASFGAQLGVAASSSVSQAFTVNAYSKAAGMRLLLCGGVFLLDLWLASRWLTPAQGRVIAAPETGNAIRAGLKKITSLFSLGTYVQRPALSRLLWQTWRDSNKTLSAAMPLSLFLMVGIGATAAVTNTEKLALFLCPFLLPALLGALVFRDDQRLGHRLFLATYAVRPRYVWLARHLVGLGVLVFIGVVVHATSWFWAGQGYREQLQYSLKYQIHTGQESLWSIVQTLERFAATTWRITLLCWCATFAAYGIGQFCSMLLRREVLAGFLALLLVPVLTAWVAVVGVWELSPLWFVLPIGVASMWATWLRAPDWIVGRHHLASWLKPLAALVIPLVGMLLMLPAARRSQLDLASVDYPFLQRSFEDSLSEFEAGQTEARATATELEQLVESGLLSEETTQSTFSKIEELSHQPYRVDNENLQAWATIRDVKDFLLYDGGRLLHEGQLPESLDRYLTLYRFNGQVQSNQPTNDRTIKIDWFRQQSLDAILQWAQHPDQTSQGIKDAILELQSIYQNYPGLREAVVADYQRVREVLLENELPAFLQIEKTPAPGSYLPYLANKLPWERERALLALELLTTQRLNFVDAFTGALESGVFPSPQGRFARRELGELLRQSFRGHGESNAGEAGEIVCANNWEIGEQAKQMATRCHTSFLVPEEFSRRSNLGSFLLESAEAEVGRRGLLTQLALLAYRLDHGSYPKTLAELTPAYLPQEILDPYTQQSFEYRPAGLGLPLKHYPRYDQQASLEQVGQDTPLFWSVGILYEILVERQQEQDDSNRLVDSEDLEGQGPREIFYQFEPTAYYWLARSNQIFTLPK